LAADREERGRVLGIRIGPGFRVWVDDAENRVLGFPVDWFRRHSPGGAAGRVRPLPGNADGDEDRQDRGRRG